MDMNAINKVTTPASTTVTTAAKKAAEETQEVKTNKAEELGVVYEKSSESNKVTAKDNKAIIAKLKADAEERTSQLRSIVEQLITKQGTAFGKATDDEMWKFLAKGDFTVSADVKAQAEADIAEDGYWGVEQTSDRILDFAKALAGNDPEKAEEMLEAFKEGFKQATKTWGDELPEISQRTYDAVQEKFEAWKNETATETV
ncbi:MAG: hypothetical protein IKL06_06375 [Lachnospiraceae bacterium]|nr:hypothetical protein [Lachnospiraceae bacterium]